MHILPIVIWNHSLHTAVLPGEWGIWSTSYQIRSFKVLIVCGGLSLHFKKPQKKRTLWGLVNGEARWYPHFGKSHDLEITPFNKTLSQRTQAPLFLNSNTQEIWPLASLPPPNDTARLSVFFLNRLLFCPTWLFINLNLFKWKWNK